MTYLIAQDLPQKAYEFLVEIEKTVPFLCQLRVLFFQYSDLQIVNFLFFFFFLKFQFGT